MDFRVTVLLFWEAVMAIFLLYKGGVLNSTRNRMVALVLVLGAFLLRAACLDYETLDYQDFLKHWVDYYRRCGGWSVFDRSPGNYNIPYMYFLCAFSYLDIRDLHMIKLLSIFFDVILAYGSMMLLGKVKDSKGLMLACFFTVLYLPTVVLNGSLWGQCDSIYVALAVLGIYCALDDRPALSMLWFTLSFGFKLQAVFVLPIIAVLWAKGKFRLYHFTLFPLYYILLVLPAVLLGKPFIETLTLYAGQTGSIGSGLNYNSPSVYALFYNVKDTEAASRMGIIAAFAFMTTVLLVCVPEREKLTNTGIVAAAVLLAVGIPFLLPHMHDRYFFAADILTVVMAFSCAKTCAAALLTQFASLLGYHAYLKMRYLLLMEHGARALICVILIAGALLVWDIWGRGKNKFKKIENGA